MADRSRYRNCSTRRRSKRRFVPARPRPRRCGPGRAYWPDGWEDHGGTFDDVATAWVDAIKARLVHPVLMNHLMSNLIVEMAGPTRATSECYIPPATRPTVDGKAFDVRTGPLRGPSGRSAARSGASCGGPCAGNGPKNARSTRPGRAVRSPRTPRFCAGALGEARRHHLHHPRDRSLKETTMDIKGCVAIVTGVIVGLGKPSFAC